MNSLKEKSKQRHTYPKQMTATYIAVPFPLLAHNKSSILQDRTELEWINKTTKLFVIASTNVPVPYHTRTLYSCFMKDKGNENP